MHCTKSSVYSQKVLLRMVNLLPKTRRAELKRLINKKVVASCWLFTSSYWSMICNIECSLCRRVLQIPHIVKLLIETDTYSLKTFHQTRDKSTSLCQTYSAESAVMHHTHGHWGLLQSEQYKYGLQCVAGWKRLQYLQEGAGFWALCKNKANI